MFLRFTDYWKFIEQDWLNKHCLFFIVWLYTCPRQPVTQKVPFLFFVFLLTSSAHAQPRYTPMKHAYSWKLLALVRESSLRGKLRFATRGVRFSTSRPDLGCTVRRPASVRPRTPIRWEAPLPIASY